MIEREDVFTDILQPRKHLCNLVINQTDIQTLIELAWNLQVNKFLQELFVVDTSKEVVVKELDSLVVD
jgi:hypothetical protein